MAVQERLTLRNIYLYLVCLITLVISIFAAVSLVRGVVEVVYPDPGYYSYVEERGDKVSKKEQQDQEQRAEDSQRRHAVLQLVGSGTTLLITGPLYLYHWRRVQKELSPRPLEGPTPTGPDAV